MREPIDIFRKFTPTMPAPGWRLFLYNEGNPYEAPVVGWGVVQYIEVFSADEHRELLHQDVCQNPQRNGRGCVRIGRLWNEQKKRRTMSKETRLALLKARHQALATARILEARAVMYGRLLQADVEQEEEQYLSEVKREV